MTDETRNQFASYGLEMLKWAVLHVLYQAEAEGEPGVKQDKIRQRLKIRHVPYHIPILDGILSHMEADKLVYRVHEGWSIKEKGVEVIEG